MLDLSQRFMVHSEMIFPELLGTSCGVARGGFKQAILHRSALVSFD